MTLIILIIPFWVSVVIAVRAQIGESTIFHWTCFHEWQFYAKALNLIQLKFLIIKIFAKKSHGYYENLKQNIWTELLPVPIFSGLRDS